MTEAVISFDDMILWYNHGHIHALAALPCDPQVASSVLKNCYKAGYQEALQHLAEQLITLGKLHHQAHILETATYLKDYAAGIE